METVRTDNSRNKVNKKGLKTKGLKTGNRVVGYLRVSTNTQDLENQKLGILELANQSDWKVEFVEETVSGMVNYRKRELGTVVSSLKTGDILLVSELSRLGRSMVEILTLLKDLSEIGVKVFAVKGGYELNGDSIQSKIVTMVLCMASEIERELISQRTKEALARKKKEGVQIGRPKGSLGKSKLDDKIDEIRALHEKKVGIASLARIYNCSWATMKSFVENKVFRAA